MFDEYKNETCSNLFLNNLGWIIQQRWAYWLWRRTQRRCCSQSWGNEIQHESICHQYSPPNLISSYNNQLVPLVLNIWWCKAFNVVACLADVAAGGAIEFNLTGTRDTDRVYSWFCDSRSCQPRVRVMRTDYYSFHRKFHPRHHID